MSQFKEKQADELHHLERRVIHRRLDWCVQRINEISEFCEAIKGAVPAVMVVTAILCVW